MAKAGTVPSPDRIYTDPDAFGHRRLIYAKGQPVPWQRAVDLGLVDADRIPAGDILVQLPFDVYETDSIGAKRIVHRAGRVVSMAVVADLAERGLLTLEDGVIGSAIAEDGADDNGDGGQDPAKTAGEPEKRLTPPPREDRAGGKVRTTKVPAPEG